LQVKERQQNVDILKQLMKLYLLCHITFFDKRKQQVAMLILDVN